MFQGNFAQLMATYNQWQNQTIYQAAAKLDDTQRKENRDAYFKSIHGTLNHIVWGDLIWMARFTDEPLAPKAVGEDLYPDFAELCEARIALDLRIMQWADSLSQAWLDEPTTWTSKLYGMTQTVPRWVQVQHLFNHQTHHRGQIGTLLNQYGIDVGITDIPMLSLLNQ